MNHSHYLLFAALLLVVTQSASGQEASMRSSLKGLDSPATEVLSVGGASTVAAYDEDRVLVFREESRRNVVPLGGTLVAHAASARQHRLAVVVRPAEAGSVAVHLFDEDGRQRWQKRVSHEPDAPFPVAAASDAGDAVALGRAATSEVTFLGAEGRVRQRVSLFKETPYALEKDLQLAFSPDGQRVAVAAMKAPASAADPAKAFLFLFDARGTLLWRRALAGPNLQQLSIAPGGERVAVSTYDGRAQSVERRSQFFDFSGTLQQDVPVGARAFVFSDVGKRVLLVSTDSAAALDLKSGEVAYRYTAPAPIAAADWTVDGRAALVVGASRWSEEAGSFARPVLRLTLLDRDGQAGALYRLETEQVRSLQLRAGEEQAVVFSERGIETVRW